MLAKPQMKKFYLNTMQNLRNSGVVPCAGNLKFGMRLSLASLSITKKYPKFRRRARASRALSKLVKIMIFAQKWSKNNFFWFHVLIDGSVALWGGAARQKSCSPGLSSK